MRKRYSGILFFIVMLLAGGLVSQAQIPGQGPLAGLEASAEAPFEGTYDEGFEAITALMERYDGRGNVSLIKLGRVAMTMVKRAISISLRVIMQMWYTILTPNYLRVKVL